MVGMVEAFIASLRLSMNLLNTFHETVPKKCHSYNTSFFSSLIFFQAKQLYLMHTHQC